MLAGYVRAWMSWLEAVNHVDAVSKCGSDGVYETLRVALSDGAIASRDAATYEPIPSTAWAFPIEVIGRGLMFPGLPGGPYEVELRRADLLQYWPEPAPSPTAAALPLAIPAALTEADAQRQKDARVVAGSVREFVSRYIEAAKAAGRVPTKQGLEKAWHDSDHKGHRETHRSEFNRLMGVEAPGRGRPRKSA